MALKRNENLKVLSREHHYGLLFSWKIREGLQKSIPTERMRPFVEYLSVKLYFITSVIIQVVDLYIFYINKLNICGI